MKIKFIKPPAKYGLGYFVGDVCDIDDKQGQELIEAGYAEKETSKETETKVPSEKKGSTKKA